MRLEHICRAFGIEGTFAEGGAFGNGLINDTFAASFEHNLHRARNQFQLVRQLNSHENEMNDFVQNFITNEMA